MEMHRSKTHEMLARQTADDVARGQFIIGLKRHMRTMAKGNETTYVQRAEPRFRARHGRSPASIEEIAPEMEHEPYYRLWSALTRVAQEMMWQAVESTIDHDMPRMLDVARKLTRSGQYQGVPIARSRLRATRRRAGGGDSLSAWWLHARQWSHRHHGRRAL